MENAPAGKEKKSSQRASSADTAGEVAELRRQLALAKEANLLLQSESRQMLQHAGHGIRVINKDSTVRYINQSFAEMSGINPAESIGKKCWEYSPALSAIPIIAAWLECLTAKQW
jgi:PAS domain-containing protein